jgi:HTH-type transcriptional repressor of puuD
MSHDENIGALLNRERIQRKVTIRALARKAGLSPAIISRIEQGHSSPSFATLKKILDVFGLSFAEFFGSQKSAEESPIIRKKDMRVNRGIGEGLLATVVNAGRSKELQLFREVFEPGGHYGKEMLTHQSVEAGICVKGTLRLDLGDRTYTVSEGDGWFFDSTIPHRFSNPTKKQAILVSANTPGTF